MTWLKLLGGATIAAAALIGAGVALGRLIWGH